MGEKISLANLEEHLTFFRKMYDVVRLVDPLKKRVLDYRCNGIKDKDNICYKYWKSKRICENCISVRSYQEDKSFTKIEKTRDNIMLVTAISIGTLERPIVLELLKDATDSMMIGLGDYEKSEMVYDIISRLNDMVTKDSLTTIYNRRFIDERLPVDIISSTIRGNPLSLIFIDVDNLKEINDNYGHNIGDITLKEVASAINGSIRGDDWVGRYGGDEFVVCLKNADDKEAEDVCKRIKKTIEGISISTAKEDIRVSLSMGIYTMNDEKLTPEEIIKYADEKMYEDKKSKRNKFKKAEAVD